MGTNYIAPTWRMPENTNKGKLSSYSIACGGSNNYITVDDNIFSGLETWSMAGFYNLSTLTVDSALFGKYANSPQQILLYWDNPLGWRLLWSGVSSTGQLVQLPTIQANEWHFIAITYDGTTVKMYLDDQVYTNSVTTGAIISDTLPWQIGADGNGTKDFNGKLSQLSFYNYAVEATEIAYLRNGGNPLVINGAEPIAYYPLGDNSNPAAPAGYPNIISDADSVFEFNSGSTNFIKAFDLPVTTFTEATFSAWVNFQSVTGTYQYVMGMGSGPGNFMSISKNQNSGTWYTYDGTGTKQMSTSPVANRWYHVVVTQTGTVRRFYIDGVEDANSPFTCPALAIPYDNLTLGAYNNQPPSSTLASPLYRLDGQLSNVQVWDTALELSDVDDLYNNGQPLMTGTQPQEANLRAWYKLNQSAVLTPGVPTNWTITKIGSPSFGSGTNDGCYAGTAGTSPYNSGLVWHDNNSGATVGSDYFQWNSPTIFTSGNNIVLSSSGGSYNGQFGGGSQAILEYNIDDGSWVNWHTQTNPTTGSNPTFTIPSTGNLTVSNNIKIRIKGVDFGSGGSYLKINDINATGGTSSYNESFTNATRYGFSGGAENQPPATFSANHWDMPDNRSAYPQAMEVTGSSSGGKITDSNFFSDGTTALNGFNFTPAPYNTAGDKYAICTISWWQKLNYDPTLSGTYTGIFDFASQYNTLQLNYSHPNKSLMYLTIFTTNRTWQVAGAGATVDISDQKWHHYCLLIPDTTTSATARLFIDNNELTGTGGGANTGGYPMQRMQIATSFRSTNSDFSNVQVFNSILSDPQVETLYNNGVPLITASVEPSNLKAWYKLDNNDVWNPVLNQWEIINYAN